MSLEDLVTKYIQSSEHALESLNVTSEQLVLTPSSVQSVIQYAHDYLSDAKYYKDKKRFDVSLTSVAYCEGLLDALRLLGAVRFEWLARPEKRRKR